jgi:hypothetical protein
MNYERRIIHVQIGALVRPRALARPNGLKEEWDRYCNAELVDRYPIEIDAVTEKPKKEQKGPLYWWGEYARLYPWLAQMAQRLALYSWYACRGRAVVFKC